MPVKYTRKEKIVLYMLRTVHEFVELGLIPIDAIKPESRFNFNKKNVNKILKNFEPDDGEGYEVLDYIVDYKKLPKEMAYFIGGVS